MFTGLCVESGKCRIHQYTADGPGMQMAICQVFSCGLSLSFQIRGGYFRKSAYMYERGDGKNTGIERGPYTRCIQVYGPGFLQW